MKKIKFSLLIAFLGIASLVSAQSASFSVKGGLNLSNMYGDIEDTKVKPGFHVGVGADIDFTYNMGIQTGLFYSAKGTKSDKGYGTLNTNYLQLPVHFAYKIDATPGTRIVLHAGPYIAYGIGGKTEVKEKGVTISVDTFGDKDEALGFKRFDAGLGLGIGAEFGRILVDLGWDMGLTNLMKDSKLQEVVAKDNKVKTQNAYITVGYKF